VVAGFYLATALIAAATLMLRVVGIRLLSVISWYYLAFFVIGIAMFGLSAGGIWVYLKPQRFTPSALPTNLSSHCCAFAVYCCVFACWAIFAEAVLGVFRFCGH
jgi:hypothetical protein